MEPTKYDIAKDSGVQHQEALVKKSLPSPKKRQRFLIPGGKIMMDKEQGSIQTKEDLTEAVYTWLRHTRFFNEVKVGFAKDNHKMKTQTNRVVDFDATPDGSPIWQIHPARKYFLAEKIADIIFSNKNVVSVEVVKTGISVTIDEGHTFGINSKDWEPYVEFLPNYKAKGEFAIYRS
jgi:hypothetical protein